MIILNVGDFKTIEEACGLVNIVKGLNIPDGYLCFDMKGMDMEIFERASRYCHILRMNYGCKVYDALQLSAAIYSGALCFLRISDQNIDLIGMAPDEDRIIIDTANTSFKTDRDNTDIIYTSKVKDNDKLKKGFIDDSKTWDSFKKIQPKIYEFNFSLIDKNKKGYKELEMLVKEKYDTSAQDLLKEEYENNMHDTGPAGVKENTGEEH